MSAVSNIASRKLLHLVLRARKQSVGELLGCIRSFNTLKISADDFGESRHTASTEPSSMIRVIALSNTHLPLFWMTIGDV